MFACLPTLYILHEFRLNNILDSVMQIFLKGITCLFFACSCFTVFVLADSIYFGFVELSLSEMATSIETSGLTSFFKSNFTITPLNFLMYNLQTENLEKHGLHPRYTHIAVNCQILFGFLGLFAVRDVLRCAKKRSNSRTHYVLLLSYFVPTVMLSVFPHQEARFLIPLLVPLAVLYSTELASNRVWKILWIGFNLTAGSFFGIAHQGGIIPAICSLQTMKFNDSRAVDIVFWHTYMPPQHLFLQQSRSTSPAVEHSNGDIISEQEKNFYSTTQQQKYRVTDLAGSTTEDLLVRLTSLHLSNNIDKDPNYFVILVTPGSLQSRLNHLSDLFHFELVSKFWPHFTGEDLPSFRADILCEPNISLDSSDISVCLSHSLFDRIHNVTSLKIFKVTTLIHQIISMSRNSRGFFTDSSNY